MAEYIEREAALKEFEKVCNVCMALVNKPMCGDCSVADTVRKVKSIPAADVRPVVFCKDCRHRDPEDHKCDCGQLERAGCVFPVDDDYFCAHGEKRE